MSALKVNKTAKQIFVYVVILFMLLLSAININNFLQPRKQVLGIETQNIPNVEFWQTFLKDHPNYIPGWIELGRLDRVKEIDPNYF